jgi:hypothetical protein
MLHSATHASPTPTTTAHDQSAVLERYGRLSSRSMRQHVKEGDRLAAIVQHSSEPLSRQASPHRSAFAGGI